MCLPSTLRCLRQVLRAQVAESWAFGMLVLFAGLLPDPMRSVASTSIAFNTYGITYMPFLAESIAVSTRCACSPCQQRVSSKGPAGIPGSHK